MTKKQKNKLIRIVVGFILTVMIYLLPIPEKWEWAALLVPYFVLGCDILKKALSGIVRGQVFDENFLMGIATVGAYLIGEYVEAVAVLLFYQLGELFESYAVGKSRRNISELMNIRPDYANVMTDGEIQKLDPNEVEVGTEIIVFPGERVPIDGIITEGETQLEVSALTGESLPAEASVGTAVFSGSVNISGKIKLKTTKVFGESTVSKILDLIQNAAMKKSKSENFITRFARVYTPAVCISALLLFLLPPLVSIAMGNAPMWSEWLFRSLTFLVISCPCALVISVPLSFFGGIGAAGKKGILIKGSNYLEKLSDTKTVVFDKTGTLTKGTFEVTGSEEVNCSEKELLYIAAALESGSKHPIAKSVVAYAKDKLQVNTAENIKEIPGQGISGTVDGKTALAGNTKLMKTVGIELEETEKASTVVHVAFDGEYKGCIYISDVIKKTIPEALKILNRRKIKTVMLTGDRNAVAQKIANELSVSEFYSELLPNDKVEHLEKLLEGKGEKGTVVFVGDGINDAPVLARSDIGVAMGALGADAAIESADIVLMDDDLLKLCKGMEISKKTLKIVRQNIAFSLAVKFLCLILGALGIANMWISIFADVGVMVIAVLNAMRTMK
ncbi:MAG: cadmium-translocating P-type ATPase [Clostridia bacterium]|nr:cadmium-translocating P-type ATPase [Clostridia bacterium]